MDVVGGVMLADGWKASIVTGVDEHSRFCVSALVVSAFSSAEGQVMRPTLVAASMTSGHRVLSCGTEEFGRSGISRGRAQWQLSLVYGRGRGRSASATSSQPSCGNLVRISSTVIPSATMATTVDTGIRVPRTRHSVHDLVGAENPVVAHQFIVRRAVPGGQ